VVARSLRALRLLAQGFAGEAITLRASALTYLTLLSLVPALAVVFAVVQAASSERQIQEAIQRFVNEQLGIGAGTNVASALSGFVSKAHVSTVGSIGFALLLVSVVSLLWNIESAFNHIYGVRRPRQVLERLLKYWTFLTLGPILLTASVAITWKISQLSGQHGQPGDRHSEALHALAALSSVFVTYAGLTILYKVLPNARVRLRSAIVAGLLAGTAWELAKYGFALASTSMVQVHKIYGSLAALPIILTWIYISWVIALVGCRFCYALETSRHPEPEAALQSAEARETFVARALLELVRLHRELGAPVSPVRLSRGLSVRRRLVREAMVALARHGLAVEARKGGWLPGKDPSRMTLASARAAARETLRHPAHPLDSLGSAVAASWGRADAEAASALGETVAQVLARVESERPAQAAPPVAEGELARTRP